MSEQPSKLNPRQLAFIDAYLGKCRWNATASAKAAGYSAKTARSIGQENLTKPDIRAEIDRRLSLEAMSAPEVLTRLREHASADLGPYMDEDGRVDLKGMKRDGLTHLIREYSYEEVYVGGSRDGSEPPDLVQKRRVKLVDSQHALELLAKHHKLLTEKLEVGGKDGGPLVLRYENNWRDVSPEE